MSVLQTHLGGKTLEEGTWSLRADHVLDDSEARDVLAEVGVLDTGLDNVEGRGDSDRRNGTSDGRDEV